MHHLRNESVACFFLNIFLFSMHFQVLKNFKTAKKVQKQLVDNGFTAEQTEAILHGVMNIIEDGEFVTKPFLKSELAHFRAELIEKLAHSEKN